MSFRVMKSFCALVSAFSMIVVGSVSAEAADWGTIKGRILIDGTPAKPGPLDASKDKVCAEKKPVNEVIVVGKDNALVNAVVYLRLSPGKKVEVNPAYDAEMNKAVEIDNNGCAFKPHVTLVRVGQSLDIKNSDPTGHNTNIQAFAFNQTIASNQKVTVKASTASPLPSPVVCNIHPFMKGYILSQNHPYMAATGEDGTFEIKDIPAGKHDFQFWHEAAGYLKDVEFKGGKADRRGRAELTIAAGQTLDLGDIKVKASDLKVK